MNEDDVIPQDWYSKSLPSYQLVSYKKPEGITAIVKWEPPVNGQWLQKYKPPQVPAIEIPEIHLKKLRPFQIEGVAYALEHKKCFIADEMGLGKTVQAIVATDISGKYPCLIVCPATLKYNWENEIKKWLGEDKKIQIPPSTSLFDLAGKASRVFKALKPNMDFIIVNYDILQNHIVELEGYGFKTIIFDESHYLKNEEAKRTHFARKLSTKEIPQIFCLTGTAILNRPHEIIPQLRILDQFAQFGSHRQFLNEFCMVDYRNNVIGVKNLDFLNDRLRKTCYIRRLKADVLKELPSKQSSNIEIEIDNPKEYKEAEENLQKFLMNQEITNEKFLRSVAMLDPLTRFVREQEYKSSRAFKSQQAEALVRIEILKQVVAKGKFNAVCEWVDSFLEGGEKLVIFANHIDIQKKLKAKYPNCVTIASKDSLEERQANVVKFQTDPNCKLIVCSLQAGGLGITLTAASTVITMELGWTPAIHLQAEDRLHRIGQKDSVNSYYFIGKNTIDEWIMELLQKKQKVVTATLEGKEPGKQINIYSELLDRLRRKRSR